MPCPNRKCKKGEKCQNNHVFSLKSLSTDTYFRNSLNFQVCPTLDRNGNVIANSFPVFNTDKKTYTPAFCLDLDKNYSPEQDQQMLMDHLRKVKDSIQEKQQILYPKPSHKSKYCSVCKENYEDYLTHISSSSHKKFIHKSKFNKYIGEVCSIFKSEVPNKEDRQETTKDDIFEQYERPTARKIAQTDSVLQSLEQKMMAQPSITNFSTLNRENSYMYNPFYGNIGMVPQMCPSYYYFQNSQMSFPMQLPWYMQYPSYLFPAQQSIFHYNPFPSPILISDDE